jgi:hypothetical protein
MSEHDETRRMLDEFRDSLQPTLGDQTRVRQAIAAIESRRAWWRGLVWRCSALAAVTAAAIVLVLAWMRAQGIVGDDGERPSQAPHGVESPRLESVHEHGSEGGAKSVGTTPPLPASEPAPRPVQVEPPLHAPTSTESVPRSRSVPRAGSSGTSAPEDVVRSEAPLVEQARRALDDGELETVIALAAEHTRRFPDGVLAVEVGALRALALCGAGRLRQGRGEAVVFLREHPRAPYRDRIRRACGLENDGEAAQ